MYILAQDQLFPKYPYSFNQLKQDNPQTSFPSSPSAELFESYGVYEVAQATQPTYEVSTHRVTEGTPTLLDGVWTQVWNVIALTSEELIQYQANVQQTIVDQTQQRLDDFACTRNYDGILSLCTYATSTVPKFQSEGQYGVEARDATYATLYNLLSEIQTGTRPMPSGFADIEADLPILTWPV